MKLFERLRNRNKQQANQESHEVKGFGGAKRLDDRTANEIGDDLNVELQEWMAEKLASHPGFEDVRADDRIIMSAHIYAAAIVAMAHNFGRLEGRAQAVDDYINGTIKSIHETLAENRDDPGEIISAVGDGGQKVTGQEAERARDKHPVPKRPQNDGKVIDLATAKPWGNA